MTFKRYSFLKLACSLCLAASGVFTAGPPTPYTTITNKIDIMGAVESPQENNTEVNRGRNISEISPTIDSHVIPSAPGFSDIVADAVRHFSYFRAFGSPSISVSSSEPNIRTISYSAPGGVFISHGYPGFSYVYSTNHRQPQPPIIISGFTPFGKNFGTINDDDKITIPKMSDSRTTTTSSFSTIPANLDGKESSIFAPHSDSNSKIIIYSGDSHLSSTINTMASSGIGTYGYTEHPAYAAAKRNLEAARQLVDGISTAFGI